MGDTRVRKRDDHLQHMIDRLAIKNTARTSGIVGDHSADRGAARRGYIGCEPQAQRRELYIQLVQDDSRLNAHPAFLGIQLQNLVVVFRQVHDEAFADHLSSLRSTAAPHRIGAVKPSTNLNDANYVLAVFWYHDSERLDLINACV